jgi:sulfur carrier protein ThiS
MISLTIGTNTERKTVIVEPTAVLADVLAENSVDTASAALHLNGALIPGCDTECSFEELGVEDGSQAMLIAVVKADSAQ